MPPQEQDRHAQARARTPRQLRFVEEYLVDLNATAACGLPGYKCRGDAATAGAAPGRPGWGCFLFFGGRRGCRGLLSPSGLCSLALALWGALGEPAGVP